MDLATQLAIQLGKRQDKTVLITVHPKVEHGHFVTILDTVKQQGAEKIALLKKKPGAAS
jgi:biopolymer transport protein ExbD